MTRSRLVSPSAPTRLAVTSGLAILASTAVYLLVRYPGLPDLLPVHFTPYGYPDGWQYKTHVRVLIPALVQVALVLTFGSVGLLLLSRPDGGRDDSAPDVRAASAAVEAIALLALVWVAFQAYAAFALVAMWERQRAGLGVLYTIFELTGVTLTVMVFARAHARFGRPEPRPFIAAHWRLGQLYNNPADPALFVPTRDGSRWTLNFGRPIAAALLAIVLAGGIIGPAAILRLLLR